MRWRTTAILRATATLARFMPRLLATARPHRLSAEKRIVRDNKTFASVMGPSLSSRGRAAHSPFTLAGSWASEVRTSPQHLAAGYLLPYVVSAELPT